MDHASRIRGLAFRRNVPCKVQNQSEVRAYLLETIEQDYPSDKMRAEEKAYKMLGLLPDDFPYKEGLISLYTEQIGGYYDPRRGHYAMAAWMPVLIQLPIAVHELTHALQDQHFDLKHLMNSRRDPSDLVLARSALVEGDATAVMMDFSRGVQGQPPISEEASISGIMMQSLLGSMFSPAMKDAPQSLRSMLMFPYVSGLNFAHVILKRGRYKELNRVFRRPPVTTEEILHPEKYFAGIKDYLDVSDPKPPTAQSMISPAALCDRMGEFMVSTLLANWLSPLRASTAAAGWGGDRLCLYASGQEAKGLLLWKTVWDTEKDAGEFLDALVEAYSLRFSRRPEGEAGEFSFSDSPYGGVSISKTDREVFLIVGDSR